MFKFIHAADIHLDSPLVGLPRYEGAPVERLRDAIRQAFCNLIDLAIAERVAFVLIAGDLYDGDWKDYKTGLFLASQMSKLREAGILVVVIAGNHDASSQITKHLRMPDNVKVMATRKPETYIIEDFGVAAQGQGFPTRAVMDDLSAAYPEPDSHLFNIGLLHTAVDGREGHDWYAPCSLQGLLSKGYDYWALGHVHKREVLHRDPWIIFPGNIQGRHARELGPKGCTLVTVHDGRVISAEHQDLDLIRWTAIKVDASGVNSSDEVLTRVTRALKQEFDASDGRALAARIKIIGPCKAHGEFSVDPDHWINEVRTAATDLSNGEIWLERIEFQTSMEIDLDEIIAREDALGGLLRAIRDLDADDDILVELGREFTDLQRKLPSEIRTGIESLDLESPDRLRAALTDVKQLLLARLLSQEKVL